MIKNVVHYLGMVNKVTNELVNTTGEIFYAINKRDFKQLDLLNKKQMMSLIDLQDNKKALVKEIERLCFEEGVEEIKLSKLMHLMNVGEREEVRAYQKDALVSEQLLANNLEINKRQIELMMAPIEAVVEGINYQRQNDMDNKPIRIDKKY